MVITFNYKDGAKTITFEEIENAINGSDLTDFAAPSKAPKALILCGFRGFFASKIPYGKTCSISVDFSSFRKTEVMTDFGKPDDTKHFRHSLSPLEVTALTSAALSVQNTEDGVGGIDLRIKVQMGVNVGRCGNIAVSEPHPDILQRHALAIQKRSARVPQVVKANISLSFCTLAQTRYDICNSISNVINY